MQKNNRLANLPDGQRLQTVPNQLADPNKSESLEALRKCFAQQEDVAGNHEIP